MQPLVFDTCTPIINHGQNVKVIVQIHVHLNIEILIFHMYMYNVRSQGHSGNTLNRRAKITHIYSHWDKMWKK